MNKLKTINIGGFPFVLDDIRWEQDAIREAFLGLTTSWGITAADSYILSGCVFTDIGPSYAQTEGYLVIAGEIYKAEATNITKPAPGDVIVFDIITTFDSAGNKTFESGGTADTYEIRKARPVVKTLPVTDLVALTAPTIHDKITDAVNDRLSLLQTHVLTNADVKAFDGVTASSFGVDPIVTTDAKIIKYHKQNKKVDLDIRINGASTGLAGITKFLVKLPNNWKVTGGSYTGTGRFINIVGGVEPVGETRATAINLRAGSGESVTVVGDAILIEPSRWTYEKFNTGGGSGNLIIEGSITVNID